MGQDLHASEPQHGACFTIYVAQGNEQISGMRQAFLCCCELRCQPLHEAEIIECYGLAVCITERGIEVVSLGQALPRCRIMPCRPLRGTETVERVGLAEFVAQRDEQVAGASEDFCRRQGISG